MGQNTLNCPRVFRKQKKPFSSPSPFVGTRRRGKSSCYLKKKNAHAYRSTSYCRLMVQVRMKLQKSIEIPGPVFLSPKNLYM